MNTPRIVVDLLDWYASLPRWQRWAPIAGVLFLWALIWCAA